MSKLVDNYIRENIENLKDTNGFKFEGLVNVVLYNITKKYGNNRELVILEGINTFKEIDKEYLYSFGIIDEKDIERILSSSEVLNRLLIIEQEDAEDYKKFLANKLDSINYTHVCIEKTFSNYTEYFEYKSLIEAIFGAGVKDIMDNSVLKIARSTKEGIDLYLLGKSNLGGIKIVNGKDKAHSIIKSDMSNPNIAYAFDISHYIVNLHNSLRNPMKANKNFNTTIQLIIKDIYNLITRLRSNKSDKKVYLISYLPNAPLTISQSYFDNLSAMVLTQILYNNSKSIIAPLMSQNQTYYSYTHLSNLLYNKDSMFVEDRLDYLTSYPELSFIDRGVLGTFRVTAVECDIKMDITAVKYDSNWDRDAKLTPINRLVDIDSIDLLSIKNDFMGLSTEEFRKVCDNYKVDLEVLENSIDEAYLLNVLDLVKFRFVKPENVENIDPDIDYDAVYLGKLNMLDYRLRALTEKLSAPGVRSLIRTEKIYSENDMNLLIPAILVVGGKAHMAHAKAVLNQLGKCLGEKEQPRIDYKLIAPSDAIMLYNIHNITDKTYELNDKDKVDLLNYCLYNEEAVTCRHALPGILKPYISKKKIRSKLKGINCFGIYTKVLDDNLLIDLDTLQKY